MWVGVLGPTAVRDDAGPVPLPAAKHRALIAALALSGGRPVSADALIDALWGEDAPASAQSTLQSYLSVVRRTLEPGLTARQPSTYVVSSDQGYRLAADEIDADTFARLVGEAHTQLGALTVATIPSSADPAVRGVVSRLDGALELWRGTPYTDMADEAAAAERSRLEELHLLALEDRATARVACGIATEAIGDLEALTTAHPLRERLWILLAVALARSGRQADALAAIERLRHLLDDELGIDPSPAVGELQTAILRQEIEPAAVPDPDGSPAYALPNVPVPDWPLIGRDAQLDALLGELGRTKLNIPQFAVVVGEPGAGKSRLSYELGKAAIELGARVLVGRCTQEQDAPPLWPWSSALGTTLTAASSADHDAQRFQIAEEIRSQLEQLSTDDTVVLFLEDLHWADSSSLRVLRHLIAHLETGRLLIVCTWRSTEADRLTEISDGLARRHPLRLELGGLSNESTLDVLSLITSTEVDPEIAEAICTRTEGNPFFVIEYARLARDKGVSLAEVLDTMPRSVVDVLQSRIHQLPPEISSALTAGAAIGREFDTEVLAAALGQSEEATLDLLEVALAANLIQDLGADRFRFGHALARDAAYEELSPSRRERLHARLAEIVEAAPTARTTRASEIARHWASAGLRYVDRAWRAAAHAGATAMRASAAEESVRHYAAALELSERDPAVSDRDRYDILVGYADACRWSTRLVEATTAVDEAIELAHRLEEPELVVRAASVLSAGSIWPWRPYGEVSTTAVAAMRDALDRFPATDSETRCRLMMALSRELYYSGDWDEVDALSGAAVETARRLGDPYLLVDMLLQGYCAQWRRGTVEARLAWADESVAIAIEHQLAREHVDGRFLQVVTRYSLGQLQGIRAELDRVVEDARRERLYDVEMATLVLMSSDAVLRDDNDAHVRIAARLTELDDLISMANKADAIQGAMLWPTLWDENPLPPVEFVTGYLDIANIPVAVPISVAYQRKGALDEARQLWGLADHDPGSENWYSEVHYTLLAEAALHFGDRQLGDELYQRLLASRGALIIAGSGPAYGPAEAPLALAAAARGDLALAREHADVAVARTREWDFTAFERWFTTLRARYDF